MGLTKENRDIAKQVPFKIASIPKRVKWDFKRCILFLSFFFFGTGATCRILIPQPGTEPGSLAVKASGPNHQEIPKTHIFLIDYSDSVLLLS